MNTTESHARGTRDIGLRGRLDRLAAALKRHRTDFDPHYMELQRNFMPRRGRFRGADTANPDRGKAVNGELLNTRPALALRTLKSGMQAGITSPARPWFKLVPAQTGMAKRHAVKLYTQAAQEALLRTMHQNGAYNALHTAYGDLGLFGTDCIICEEDLDHGFVLHTLVPGQYWLGADGGNRITTLYMEDMLTVEQIVGRFVYRNNPRSQPDWSVVSQTVKNLWDRGNRSNMIPVARMVYPRANRDTFRLGADNKAIASVWWEVGSDSGSVLRDSGYDRNPVVASRWYQEGSEVYGMSPAMYALPEAKMLQVQMRDKAEAQRRMNRPPVQAPTSMRNNPFSLTAGAVLFSDDEKGVRPVHTINPPIDAMRVDINETEERINEAMFANLFMMLAQMDRRMITAREIEERHAEKMIGLGPVLELQHAEKLRPLVALGHYYLTKQGKIPEPPQELDRQTMTVEYTSVLAQAQKAIGTASVERLYGFAGNLAAVTPEIVDNLDPDGTINEYAEMLGVSPVNLRDPEVVAENRRQRAEAEQQAQQAEMAAQAAATAHQGAQAAKVMSEASSPRGQQPGDVLRRIGIGG